jgi:anti-sigma B factor antagonist/stage II sporulation protein AA (anti-sigma F factor antagonist)
MFTFSMERNENKLEVHLIGDLDIDGTEVMEEKLIPSLLECKEVDVNFEHVPFVDSSGMGLLINLVHTLTEKKIKVTISNVISEVMEVFDLLQLPEILGENVFVH